MKNYEIHLYEVEYKTLMFEIEARGEKEAIRKALKAYKIEGPDDSWITGWKVEGHKAFLVGNTDE